MLEGDIEFLLELPGELHTCRLLGRGAVVVPRGIWHTAKVFKASRMLFVTLGAGTEHRPVTTSEFAKLPNHR